MKYTPKIIKKYEHICAFYMGELETILQDLSDGGKTFLEASGLDHVFSVESMRYYKNLSKHDIFQSARIVFERATSSYSEAEYINVKVEVTFEEGLKTYKKRIAREKKAKEKRKLAKAKKVNKEKEIKDTEEIKLYKQLHKKYKDIINA